MEKKIEIQIEKEKEIEKMIEVANQLEWSVTIDGEDIMFRKYSPAGQDFSINIIADNLKNIIKEIKESYDNFDCSRETYLWLDDTGHGTNGAPYDMKDVYEDMSACEEMTYELYNKLLDLDYELQ